VTTAHSQCKLITGLGIALADCQRQVYEKSSLDRSLNQLFQAIDQLRNKPSIPLYSHLPATITVNLADVPVSMVLSPRLSEKDEAWAVLGEVDDQSSSDEEESEFIWEESTKQPGMKVEPWQTLLLVDENPKEKSHNISSALVGLGVRGSPDAPLHQVPRKPSKETSLEEDEDVLMKSLIEACDVSKP